VEVRLASVKVSPFSGSGQLAGLVIGNPTGFKTEFAIKAGEINVEAYDGCVTLRGQLEHPGDIRRLVEATRRVEGVREVRSYLHLPGTLPPNKAEIYEREVAPRV
jgi:hypothetical protein